jgi:hypothetical protein
MLLEQTKDPDLKKDPKSGGILNTNQSALSAYKQRKQQLRKITTLEKRINTLENQVNYLLNHLSITNKE